IGKFGDNIDGAADAAVPRVVVELNPILFAGRQARNVLRQVPASLLESDPAPVRDRGSGIVEGAGVFVDPGAAHPTVYRTIVRESVVVVAFETGILDESR